MSRHMHLIVDAFCEKGLDNPGGIEDFIKDITKVLGLTINHVFTKEFSNGSQFGPGITSMVLLSESHIVVHTNPQNGLLNLDIFSCKEFEPKAIWPIMNDFFSWTAIHRSDIIYRE